MDHLVCFMGGLLALGAATSEGGIDGSDRAKRDFELGQALTHTCYQM
jgi:mannosyl-oligosaccharide alpha-1,2-mannosidase